MTESSNSIDIQELLAHADWVRRIARSLVSDPSIADDVVQDTWLAALRRPLASGRNLRGWLRKVVLNQARQTGRGAARRSVREKAAARDEATPSLSELAASASMQREVVQHVLALEEPFRAVVLLRFFENLSPPEIARRLDVPLKTVHSRLQRAFEKLRARMNEEYGDRAHWCLALEPLLVTPGHVGPLVIAGGPGETGTGLLATAGIWLMNANAKIGVAIAIALFGGIGFWRLAANDPASDVREPSAVDVEPGAPSRSTLARNATLSEGPAPGESARAAVAVPGAAEATSEATLQEKAMRIRCRAVDLSGAGIAGVGIAVESSGDTVVTTTTGDGSFEIVPSESALELSTWRRLCIFVVDDQWITLRKACAREGRLQQEHIVIAVPVTSLDGWVEDADGVPIDGAQVSLGSWGESFFGFPYALDSTSVVRLERQTTAGGRFTFERFPDAPGLPLTVEAEGFVTGGVSLDEEAHPLVIRLDRVGETDQVYQAGVVLDEHGFAVEGASVKLGASNTKTDRLGFFRIPINTLDEATPLCAAKAGRLPVLIPNFATIVDRQDGVPEPVELVLGGEPVGIRGRVIDSAGDPCVGWSVSVTDETVISQYRIPVTTAEGLARGAAQVVDTDEEGKFELSGLFPREYTVQAYDRNTLERVEAKIQGGDDRARVIVPRTPRRQVRGTVVNSRGVQMPNISLRLALDTFKSALGSQNILGSKAVTDADGAFSFAEVPVAYVYLKYSGEGVQSGSYHFPAGYTGDDNEITVVQECRFRLELADSSAVAKTAEFFDLDNRRLQVRRYDANGMSGFFWAQLVSGKSEVLSVVESACLVVLKDGAGNELSRHAIKLDPDEVRVLGL